MISKFRNTTGYQLTVKCEGIPPTSSGTAFDVVTPGNTLADHRNRL